MEITICDLYSFHEKIYLDHEITCKDLKEKITSQFGRDTTNCTIFFNKEPLKESKPIQLDSSIPFIIIDGNIEKVKNQIDCNNSYYHTPRFQKYQHYKKVKRPIPQLALIFNPSNGFDQNSDSSDEDDEENPLLYPTNDNNSSDTNNENTDDQEEMEDLYVHNDSDSENELSNNSSSDNEENYIDNESFSPASHNPHFLYLISQNENNNNNTTTNSTTNNNNQNRDNQNTTHRRLGGDFTVVQPSYRSFNFLVHPIPGFGPNLNPNPQRRVQQQQAESQTDTHLMNFLLPDSDEFAYDEIAENENDDENENTNTNENDNENNNELLRDFTPEERDIIRRISRENDRFDWYTIIQVFEACGRDMETTIQCLNTM